MLRCLSVLAVLVLTAPAFAGNARSDRTALAMQQYAYRQQVLNWQWAQHFRAQQQDMANYYQGYGISRYRETVQRHNARFGQWLSQSPRAYENLRAPLIIGNRRR